MALYRLLIYIIRLWYILQYIMRIVSPYWTGLDLKRALNSYKMSYVCT